MFGGMKVVECVAKGKAALLIPSFHRERKAQILKISGGASSDIQKAARARLPSLEQLRSDNKFTTHLE